MAVLAIDIGATTLKAGLVAADGTPRALASAPCPAPLEADGTSEVDVATWLRALETALSRLVAVDAAGDVEAVAITGMTRSQVLLGAEGRALRPAITWRDTRAKSVAARHGRLGAEALDAFHPAARVLWLAETEPATVARAVAVVDPKDALAAWLTGEIASDAVALARLVAAVDAAGPETETPRRLLPRLKTPGEIVGSAGHGLGGPFAMIAGRPVVMVSHDTWAAVTGMGALRPGHGYQLSGTSDVAGVIADRPITADGLLAVPWGAGLHQLGGPSQNGADTLAWAASLFAPGDDPAAAFEMLLAGPRSENPLLFLPFLTGERVPYWDTDLRGAMLGLDRRHGASDVAWAVAEGQALAGREVLERAEAALGTPVRDIRFAGGPSASQALCQLRADVTGRAIVRTSAEPGLVGAAACGYVALGRYASLAAAQGAMARPLAVFTPDPARAARHDALFAIYRQAVDATRSLSHALARFGATARPR